MKHSVLASLAAAVVIGLFANVRAQDTWLWQNPKPTLMNFNALHFPASQTATGWAVGNSGTIFRTDNGGNTWLQFAGLETTANLEGVWFGTLNAGFAVGTGGTILKGTSGGNAWTAQNSGVNQDLKAVHGLNTNDVWAVGYSGTTGVIVRTTNSGTSWTSQTYPQARFTAVRIVDGFVGYAVGLGGVIYKTVDGGITWFEQTSGTTADLRGVYFRDTETGWAVGAGGTVLRTTDGGFTWSPRTSGTTRSLAAIHFSGTTRGWIVGDSGVALRTTNGGSSWTVSTQGTPHLRALHGQNDTVLSVGATGRILRSHDGGANWTALSSGVPQTVSLMSFPTAAVGYAVGPNGTLLKSVDFGANWTAVAGGAALAGMTVNALHFPGTNVGYAAGANGVVMKTTDGGANWSTLTTGTGSTLNAVHFQTVDRGFIAGSNGTLRMTVNGGANWTTPTISGTTAYMAIGFASPKIGWVVGNNTIRKTIDSGKTWTSQTASSLSNVIGLSVVDTLNAFILRSSGGLSRTTNGGTSWNGESFSGTFRAFHFTSPVNGYLVNNAGAVGVSTDSGNSWTFQTLLPSTQPLNTIAAAPEGRIFVAGTDGAILKLRPTAPVGFNYSGGPYVLGNGLPFTPIAPTYSGIVSGFAITPPLPAGLTFDTLTGVITGVPAAAQSATTHSVTAYNEAAQASASISLTVRNQILGIEYPVSQLSLARGAPMTPQTPAVTGVAPFGPYNCTSNPPLPSGLTLEAGTCVLSGTPANAQAAVNYIITASNGFAQFNKLDTLRINVVAPPSNLTYSIPDAIYTVGQTITPNTATVTVVTGASLRYTVAPALPQGLALDSVTGTISGTPGKAAAAVMHTVTVTSTAGSTTGTVRITVNGPPADVTYPAVVFGLNVADTGRGSPTAVGAITRWSITPPPPQGLTMDTLTGKFSGTAVEPISGSAHTVTAHNPYGSSSTPVTISVLNPIVLFSYPTKSFTLVMGAPMTSVSPIVAGTLPFTPVTYVVNPALPAGLTLNANTGAISGTPTSGSQLSTKHAVTARNGVPAFNKTDTLTFFVQGTSLRFGNGHGFGPALRLDGRVVALAPPEGTRSLRVSLRDMTGRVVLDRTVEWTGTARLEGVRKSAAVGAGVLALRVQFHDESGRLLGRSEQRIPLLPE